MDRKKTLIKFNLYHLKSFNDLDSSIAQKVLSIATPKIKKMLKYPASLWLHLINLQTMVGDLIISILDRALVTFNGNLS